MKQNDSNSVLSKTITILILFSQPNLFRCEQFDRNNLFSTGKECFRRNLLKTSHVHVSTFSSLKFGCRLYCVRLRPVLSLFLSVSSIDIHKNFKHDAESLFYGRVQKYNMQLQRSCLHSINRLLDSQIEEHLDDHVNIPITYTAQSP